MKIISNARARDAINYRDDNKNVQLIPRVLTVNLNGGMHAKLNLSAFINVTIERFNFNKTEHRHARPICQPSLLLLA